MDLPTGLSMLTKQLCELSSCLQYQSKVVLASCSLAKYARRESIKPQTVLPG